MICFHFTIFVVLETTFWRTADVTLSCDLLSFYYLCRTGNNAGSAALLLLVVVICFHFTIFVVLETTSEEREREETRCDLLSFYYLCRTGNNFGYIYNFTHKVVICFHFTIFVVLETTQKVATVTQGPLWFAFILLSLSYWKQLDGVNILIPVSCDLLSFYYLCRTGNNLLVCNLV